jgi:hypothetical protein
MRKKIFIIHGKGITVYEVLKKLEDIFKLKLLYIDGKNYVSPEAGRLVRYLLYEEHDNDFMTAVEKVFITRVTIAQFYPTDNTPDDIDNWLALSPFMLKKKLEQYNIPTSKSKELEFCQGQLKESFKLMSEVLGTKIDESDDHNACLDAAVKEIVRLQSTIYNAQDGMLFEEEAIKKLEEEVNKNGGKGKVFADAMVEMRRVYEAGGDLDTLGSNALYGVWAIPTITKEKGSPPIYGIDYAFDFVNYHDGLRHLSKHKGCDIYLPDFPIDAIPDLEGDLRYLAEFDTYVRRFDDHHPYEKANGEVLEKMLQEKLIDHYAMSGPVKEEESEEEHDKENAKCGTDMIYEQLVEGKEWDNSGLKELQRLAHVQDLHIAIDDEGNYDQHAINISIIIGSKHSKIDMVQQMMKITDKDYTDRLLEHTGWDKELADYQARLEEVCPKLDRSMYCIYYNIKNVDKEYCYKRLPKDKQKKVDLFKKISFGLIDLSKFFFKFEPSCQHKILAVLSPFQGAKEARINVATAINYVTKYFKPDYFFYCYGSSLMTTRRVNPDDETIDLSVLMGKLGEGGGHAEAATCKPDAPKRFAKVSDYKFEEWVKYLADRVAKAFDYTVIKVEKIRLDKSKPLNEEV